MFSPFFVKVMLLGYIPIIAGGCAKRADDIAAAYISPLTYDAYNCEQISAEAQRVSARAAEVTGAQNQKAGGDAVAMGVGLILFWPALFFIKGGGATEAEVARMKGEMDAIEQASIQKQCGIQFAQPEPVKTAAPKPLISEPN